MLIEIDCQSLDAAVDIIEEMRGDESLQEEISSSEEGELIYTNYGTIII